MFKRTLSMLLTLVMVLSMMPLSVLASENEVSLDATGNTYTVSFDLGYGTKTIKSQKVTEDETAREPIVQERRSYELDGWFTEDGIPFDFERPVTEDVHLTAHWTHLGQNYLPVNIPESSDDVNDNESSDDEDDDLDDSEYTVTFLLNDGTAGAYQMQVVNAGETVTEPIDPVMNMYAFTGWYTEEAAVNLYDFTEPVSESLKLYAGWDNPNGDEEGGYAAASGGGTIYSITSLYMEDDDAMAVINVNSAALLEVSFYNDPSREAVNMNEVPLGDLLGTYSIATPDYCEMVLITLPVSLELPEYYYMTARLLDENGEELCNPFISILYTYAYAQYDEQTIHDFPGKTVLNFDENEDTNFGVLNDSVKLIVSNDSQNTLTVVSQPAVIYTEDGEENTIEYYVFENMDDVVDGLQSGDKIHILDTQYLFTVDTVEALGDGCIVVSAKEDDGLNLYDYYEVLKIDMSIDLKADESNAANTPMLMAEVDEDLSAGGTVTLPTLGGAIDWKPKGKDSPLTISGSLGVTGKIEFEFVYDWVWFGKDYWSVLFSPQWNATLTATVEVSKDNEDKLDKAEKDVTEIVLAKVPIPNNIPGLEIKILPKITLDYEIKGGMTFTLTAYQKTGFTNDSRNGRQNIDEKNRLFTFSVEGELTIKLGPQLDIEADFLKTKFEAEITGGAGIKLNAKITSDIIDVASNPESEHVCMLCANGTLKWYAEVSAMAEYEIIDDVLEGSLGNWTIVDISGYFGNFKVPAFYLSILNPKDSLFGGKLKLGLGTDKCPNLKHRVIVTCIDEDGNTVTGCNVSITGKASDSGASTFKTYLYDGSYKASANINGTAASEGFKVKGNPQNVTLTAIPVIEPELPENIDEEKPGNTDDPDFEFPDQEQPDDGDDGEVDESLRDIVLLLDVSGSMSGSKLTNTKATAIKFVKQILGAATDTRIAIVAYGTYSETVCGLTDDIATLETAINKISTYGMTNTYSGMNRAGSILAGSNAKKKAIVFMADGDANEGTSGSSGTVITAEGDTVYFGNYANAVYELAKEYVEVLGYTIYSFGFDISNGSNAFNLIKYTASFNTKGERNYWIVNSSSDIDGLEFVFEDIADTITTKKSIVVTIECPVEVTITLGDETLSRSNPETSFGKLIWEEIGENDYKYVFTLEDSKDYDIQIVGLADGVMNFKIEYYTGDTAEYREFLNVPITGKTTITTSPTDRDADFCLFVDGEDEDEKPDIAGNVDINETLDWENSVSEDDTVTDDEDDSEPGVDNDTDDTVNTTPSFNTNRLMADLSALYRQTFTIHAAAGEGGRITHSGDNTLAFGTNKTFVIIPDAGYVIDEITVDGKIVSDTYEYTFKDIKKDHTISVSFKAE